MDTLIVKGLGRPLDGEYEFDLVGMVVPGSNEQLKISEYRRIKQYAGIRRGQIIAAIDEDDADFEVVLTAIILERNRKQATEERIADAIDSDRNSIAWRFSERQEESADPPDGPAETPAEEESINGGKSSRQQSVSLVTPQSPTGIPVSETATSALG